MARPTITFSDLWAFRKEALNNGDEAQAALCTLAIGGRAALRAAGPGTAEYRLWKSKRTQASARHECAVLKADAEAEARHNPAFGDYLAAGRRHLATGLTKAAEEAQRAAERARAAAEREASRRQCDAPTPEQAIRVLAQAVGVAKLNPRRNPHDSRGRYHGVVKGTASGRVAKIHQYVEGGDYHVIFVLVHRDGEEQVVGSPKGSYKTLAAAERKARTFVDDAPRRNGSYYAATDSYGDTAYGVGTTAASALRDARQWYEGNVGALSVDRISRARYLAIKGGNPKASGTRRNGRSKADMIQRWAKPRRNPLPAGWTFTESAGDIFVYKQGRLFAQYTHGQWVGMLGPEWKIPPSTVLRAITKTRQGAAEAAPTTGMQVSLFGSRKNGFASHPFGWAQVQGGYVVKVSDAQRKPKGTGWGAIETSGTRIGSSAYLDRNGTVYLR